MKILNFDEQNPPGELDALACKHGTDKGSDLRRHGHGYTRWYEMLLGLRRADVRALLEIGVATGASLRMWRDYFPQAVVYGVDIKPEAIKHAGDRIVVSILDAGKEAAWDAFAAPPGGFDLIIDDGSHDRGDANVSLRVLWPLLKRGGYYFIEDFGCANYDRPSDVLHWLAIPSVAHTSYAVYPSQNRYEGGRGGQCLIAIGR